MLEFGSQTPEVRSLSEYRMANRGVETRGLAAAFPKGVAEVRDAVFRLLTTHVVRDRLDP